MDTPEGGPPIAPPPPRVESPTPIVERPVDEVLTADLGLAPDVVAQIMKTPLAKRPPLLRGVMPKRYDEARRTGMTPADRLALHTTVGLVAGRLTEEPPAAEPQLLPNLHLHIPKQRP
jgi:hypothetical protein